jgi:hypothetical protein
VVSCVVYGMGCALYGHASTLSHFTTNSKDNVSSPLGIAGHSRFVFRKCHIALVFCRPWFDPSPQYLVVFRNNFYKILGNFNRKGQSSTMASIFSAVLTLIFKCELGKWI